jgi:hypothetical protein
MSMSHAGGTLSTNAVITTAEGKQINLGQLDKKLFGRIPWTPRLWYYKHVTYKKLTKERRG